MSRISKATILLLIGSMAFTLLHGCEKSEPIPMSRQNPPQKRSPVVAQKIVSPEKIQSIQADKTDTIAATVTSDFQEGVKLRAAGEVIDVKVGHLVPHVVDWNNDGKKDMLTGQFSGGRITLYVNIGTDEAPEFGKGEILHADNKPIRLDAG
jgi:hypothetical protein